MNWFAKVEKDGIKTIKKEKFTFFFVTFINNKLFKHENNLKFSDQIQVGKNLL